MVYSVLPTVHVFHAAILQTWERVNTASMYGSQSSVQNTLNDMRLSLLEAAFVMVNSQKLAELREHLDCDNSMQVKLTLAP